ncbi:MAG TPA: peptide-methionine (S)-S-oxide reductase, partial [Candidatus Aminicenantes bacterium]|nr:peptide-methionine (S)-S-oxide reductase [Candidatus Aminicenantes bacterium]
MTKKILILLSLFIFFISCAVIKRGLEETGMKNKVIKSTKSAYFAAGCFWGVEHKFSQVKGVLSTEVGYSGGTTDNPSYVQVCSGDTGHAETTKIVYDPSVIDYEELLEKFFSFHDPTQLNRQGPDVGTQYRSVVFYVDENQKRIAEEK